MEGGCICTGGSRHVPPEIEKRAIRILLECFLVLRAVTVRTLTRHTRRGNFGRIVNLKRYVGPTHCNTITFPGVVLQFCVKKQRNKALLSKNKVLFSRNKALLRIKICVNFIFIFQNLLLNHFYCMLLSSWVLVFPLTICFYNLKIKYFKVFLPKNSWARTCLRKVTCSSPILVL